MMLVSRLAQAQHGTGHQTTDVTRGLTVDTTGRLGQL